MIILEHNEIHTFLEDDCFGDTEEQKRWVESGTSTPPNLNHFWTFLPPQKRFLIPCLSTSCPLLHVKPLTNVTIFPLAKVHGSCSHFVVICLTNSSVITTFTGAILVHTIVVGPQQLATYRRGELDEPMPYLLWHNLRWMWLRQSHRIHFLSSSRPPSTYPAGEALGAYLRGRLSRQPIPSLVTDT